MTCHRSQNEMEMIHFLQLWSVKVPEEKQGEKRSHRGGKLCAFPPEEESSQLPKALIKLHAVSLHERHKISLAGSTTAHLVQYNLSPRVMQASESSTCLRTSNCCSVWKIQENPTLHLHELPSFLFFIFGKPQQTILGELNWDWIHSTWHTRNQLEIGAG